MILTDASGRPFERPDRRYYVDVVEYLRACWAYKDRVTACANDAFDAEWRKRK